MEEVLEGDVAVLDGTAPTLRPFDDRALRALVVNAFVRFRLVPFDIDTQSFIAVVYTMPLLLMSNNASEKCSVLLDALRDAYRMRSPSLQAQLIKNITEIIGSNEVDVKEAIPPDLQGVHSLQFLSSSFIRHHPTLQRQKSGPIRPDLQTTVNKRYKITLNNRKTFDYHLIFPDRPWESESHAAAFVINEIGRLGEQDEEKRLACILLLATLTTRFDFVDWLEGQGVSLKQLPEKINLRYQEFLTLTTIVRNDQFDEFDCRALLINAFVHFQLVPPDLIRDLFTPHPVSDYIDPLMIITANDHNIATIILDCLSDVREISTKNNQAELMTKIVNILGENKVHLYDVIPMELTSQKSSKSQTVFFNPENKQSVSQDEYSVVSRQYQHLEISHYFNYEDCIPDRSWESECHAAACVIHEITKLPTLQDRLPCLLLLATLTTRFEFVDRLETQGITLDNLPEQLRVRYKEYCERPKTISHSMKTL